MLTLRLDDLLPDARGDIVILDAEHEGVTVVTDRPLTMSGVEAAHITETGLDVSGFSFYTFADGVTLFYPSAHSVLIDTL